MDAYDLLQMWAISSLSFAAWILMAMAVEQVSEPGQRRKRGKRMFDDRRMLVLPAHLEGRPKTRLSEAREGEMCG